MLSRECGKDRQDLTCQMQGRTLTSDLLRHICAGFDCA